MTYIKDAVTATSQDPTRRCLHSTDSTNYTVPRTWTKFGETALYVAGPTT